VVGGANVVGEPFFVVGVTLVVVEQMPRKQLVVEGDVVGVEAGVVGVELVGGVGGVDAALAAAAVARRAARASTSVAGRRRRDAMVVGATCGVGRPMQPSPEGTAGCIRTFAAASVETLAL